jgi:Domain of unknown function (DUF4123)
MSSSSEKAPSSGQPLAQDLRRFLFPENLDEPALNTYAILDGAAIPDLLDHLYGEMRPEFVCLDPGDLEPDMAECAPYLVELKAGTPFTTWLLSEVMGKNWGIFAITPANLQAMRKHFRSFLTVLTPTGESVRFRFYDPRVLTVYLPTANAGELDTVFGPITSYCCESRENGFVALSRRDGKLNQTLCIVPDLERTS